MNEKTKKGLSLIIRLSLVTITVTLLCVFKGFTTNIMERLTYYSVKSLLPISSVSFNKAEPDRENEALPEMEKEESTLPDTTYKFTPEELSLDEDVKIITATALKNSAKDKKGGKITEYTFTTDGVTDSFGNVRVKNTNKTQIDIEELLKGKADFEIKKKKPSVLIYHTHTTETYQLVDRSFFAKDFQPRSNDSSLNMIRVGEAIKDELTKAGFEVIHDTTVYDSTYTGAYYRSYDGAKAILEKYPTIDITLDIHRDAIGDSSEKTKPVTEINGKKAAQIMIISGCQEEGNGITDLPDWEENLVFALKLQNTLETMFPTITRPLYFCARSYNMNLTHCSLLIEMGTDANTLQEAVYSGRLLGKALAKLMEEN